MNLDYITHENWASIEDIIYTHDYEIVKSKENSFDLESREGSEMMPKVHIEVEREFGKIYFNPDMYAPALIYDEMDYPDSYEYWVKKWLKAAKLCKLLTSAVLE